MFRDCAFEYAGISSNNYNLKLYYYDRTTDTFDSGGKYDVKTDALPRSSEQFLYGLDYSDAPLEFDIEIINPDRAIPHHQLIEIKNWLFGQDGWKTFRTLDEMQDYFLKCVLIPEEDIVDGLGYRGFKCKLKNISSFWYGNAKTITFDGAYLNDPNRKQRVEHIIGSPEEGYVYWVPFEINIDTPYLSYDVYDILPSIKVDLSAGTYDSDLPEGLDIGTVNFKSIDEFVSVYKSKQVEGQLGKIPSYLDEDVVSSIYYSISDIPFSHTVNINTRYMTIDRGQFSEESDIRSLHVGKRVFRLSKGLNVCYISIPESISKLEFSYTPMYRIGAF